MFLYLFPLKEKSTVRVTAESFIYLTMTYPVMAACPVGFADMVPQSVTQQNQESLFKKPTNIQVIGMSCHTGIFEELPAYWIRSPNSFFFFFFCV